jgi:hypothetical protein
VFVFQVISFVIFGICFNDMNKEKENRGGISGEMQSTRNPLVFLYFYLYKKVSLGVWVILLKSHNWQRKLMQEKIPLIIVLFLLFSLFFILITKNS